MQTGLQTQWIASSVEFRRFSNFHEIFVPVRGVRNVSSVVRGAWCGADVVDGVDRARTSPRTPRQSE